MNRVIHKTQLLVGQGVQTAIPYAAEVLAIDLQYGAPMVWYITTTGFELPAQRHLVCIGTGQMLHDNCTPKTHVGTLIDPSGFVWHFFDNEKVNA